MSYILPTGKEINIFDEDKKYSHQLTSKESLCDLLDYYQQAIEQDDLEALEKEIHRHCLVVAYGNDSDRHEAEMIEAYLLDRFVNKYDKVQ